MRLSKPSTARRRRSALRRDYIRMLDVHYLPTFRSAGRLDAITHQRIDADNRRPYRHSERALPRYRRRAHLLQVLRAAELRRRESDGRRPTPEAHATRSRPFRQGAEICLGRGGRRRHAFRQHRPASHTYGATAWGDRIHVGPSWMKGDRKRSRRRATKNGREHHVPVGPLAASILPKLLFDGRVRLHLFRPRGSSGNGKALQGLGEVQARARQEDRERRTSRGRFMTCAEHSRPTSPPLACAWRSRRTPQSRLGQSRRHCRHLSAPRLQRGDARGHGKVGETPRRACSILNTRCRECR